MKKIIFIIAIILILIITAGTVYLNNVFLPHKIKSIVVEGIAEAAQKDVRLQSLTFSIFKGLVLNGLEISDGQEQLLTVKQASCTFLIPPLFKKSLVIPRININSAQLFVKRRVNQSLNLPVILPATQVRVGNIEVKVKPVVPAKPEFNFSVERVSLRRSSIIFEDDTLNPPFNKKIENLNLDVFLAKPSGMKFNLLANIPGEKTGLIKATGKFDSGENKLDADISLENILVKDYFPYYENAKIQIPSGLLSGTFKIVFKEGKLSLNGPAQLNNAQIKGEGFTFTSPETLSAQINFENAGLEAVVNLNDAQLKVNALPLPLEGLTGKVSLKPNNLTFKNLNFKYANTAYKATAAVENFKAPSATVEVSSAQFSLNSDFSLNENKLLSIKGLTCQLFNSELILSGLVDLSSPGKMPSKLSGMAKLHLEDLKSFPAFGAVIARFKLEGELSKLKDCQISSEIAADLISAYGLKAQDLSAVYDQRDGIGNLSALKLSFYDGIFTSTGSINLTSDNTPYWIEAQLNGLRIEKLKADTSLKDKNIAGLVSGNLKLNGFGKDLDKLSGGGEIKITEGQLWELNLFQGLGSILLGKDFSKITFSEGSCNFAVADKAVSSENVVLKSNITNLSGKAKIGFDGSIDALVDVEILSDNAPETGTFKDITTAILGQGGRFGVIRITGTLKDPKYKFVPAYTDILKGLKDTFLKSKDKD